MNDRKVAPAVQKLYPRNSAVWQDDGASIHRSRRTCTRQNVTEPKIALDSIDRNFKDRILYDFQAPKMADIWPIKNVWAIIKQELDGKEFKNIESWKQNSVGPNLQRQEVVQPTYQLHT